MTKCVYCGQEESPHRGVSLLKNDGSVNFYCSSKCRKNALKLKRDRKKMKWTEAYRVSREKAAAGVEKQEKAVKQAAAEKEEKAKEKAKEEKKK